MLSTMFEFFFETNINYTGLELYRKLEYRK